MLEDERALRDLQSMTIADLVTIIRRLKVENAALRRVVEGVGRLSFEEEREWGYRAVLYSPNDVIDVEQLLHDADEALKYAE